MPSSANQESCIEEMRRYRSLLHGPLPLKEHPRQILPTTMLLRFSVNIKSNDLTMEGRVAEC